MFDIGWSELVIFIVVALIFIGPNELPAFLRAIGRYAGMIRRQADDFKSYFDEAMREAEFDAMQRDINKMVQDVDEGIVSAKSAASSVESSLKPDSSTASPLSIDEGKPKTKPAPEPPKTEV